MKVCADCRGHGRVGGKPCGTCNPPDGILDGIRAAFRRTRNTATGKTTTVATGGGRRTTTTRSGWLAPEVTTATGRRPAKKRRAAGTPARGSAPATVSCVHGGPLSQSCPDC